MEAVCQNYIFQVKLKFISIFKQQRKNETKQKENHLHLLKNVPYEL